MCKTERATERKTELATERATKRATERAINQPVEDSVDIEVPQETLKTQISPNTFLETDQVYVVAADPNFDESIISSKGEGINVILVLSYAHIKYIQIKVEEKELLVWLSEQEGVKSITKEQYKHIPSDPYYKEEDKREEIL